MDSDLPVTHFASIPRWSSAGVPDYPQLSNNEKNEKQSPFPYSPSINTKIAYWYYFFLQI
jgi:hypothetical protein